MITHVASAGENGGRVIVQFCHAAPNQTALDAAYRIAQVFEAEIEGLMVEHIEMLDLAAYPFTVEISLNGRQTRNLEVGQLARDMRLLAQSMRKRLQRQAQSRSIPCRFNIVRGDEVAAIMQACQASGPWNVVALADPVGPGNLRKLHRLFATLANTTGVVVCGPKTTRMRGPIIIVVEQVERLSGMVKTAERLKDQNGDIILLLVARSEAHLQMMEGQMRQALGPQLAKIDLVITELTRDEPKVVAEALRRLNGGFIIGQFGGLLLSQDNPATDLLHVMRCPLLLTP